MCNIVEFLLCQSAKKSVEGKTRIKKKKREWDDMNGKNKTVAIFFGDGILFFFFFFYRIPALVGYVSLLLSMICAGLKVSEQNQH